MGVLQGSGIRELLGQGREGGWLEMQEKQGEARCPSVNRPAGQVSLSLGGSGTRLREGMGLHQQPQCSFRSSRRAGVEVLLAHSPASSKAPDNLTLKEAKESLVRAAVVMRGFWWVLSCVRFICTCSSPWQC